MAGRARTFVLAALVVVLAAGGALWWFFLRDDAPEEATLEQSDCAISGGPATADGSWEVRPGTVEEGFVGYRIEELFGGETIKKTAVGRTPDVTGSMTVDGFDHQRRRRSRRTSPRWPATAPPATRR